MSRYTLTIRPGTDFRMSFRLLYQDDDGVRTPVNIGDDEVQLTIAGIKYILTVNAGWYLIHLTAAETSQFVAGDGKYVLDRAGESVDRILEGDYHVSRYRSIAPILAD